MTFDFKNFSNKISTAQRLEICKRCHLNENEFFAYASIAKGIPPYSYFIINEFGKPANPNIIPVNTNPPLTMLMFAMAYSKTPNPNIVISLLEKGARPDFGPYGKTALEFMEYISRYNNWSPTSKEHFSKIFECHTTTAAKLRWKLKDYTTIVSDWLNFLRK